MKVSGPFLGGCRCAAGHKTHPPSPFVSFPGFFLSRVADSVSKWWSHASEGSLSPWPTTRAPTPELEEGCLRDIPGCRRSPELCPVKDVADVTVETPQENREKGKRVVVFLSS